MSKPSGNCKVWLYIHFVRLIRLGGICICGLCEIVLVVVCGEI